MRWGVEKQGCEPMLGALAGALLRSHGIGEASFPEWKID
jgi:hypothetical protein